MTKVSRRSDDDDISSRDYISSLHFFLSPKLVALREPQVPEMQVLRLHLSAERSNSAQSEF